MIMFRLLLFAHLAAAFAPDATAQQNNQKIPYGNNSAAGKYFDVGGAKIYFETYGQGKPFVLLHGGVYGYIDEFEYFIEKLSTQYKVICIATRGHGKSDAGNEPYTYEQRASDAFKLIRSISTDSVAVLGFSDGGYSAFKLAALYPEVVSKLIVIGAGDFSAKTKSRQFNYTKEKLLKDSPEFFKDRLALMPEPEKWDTVLSRLNDLYNKSTMSTETFSAIKCPTLIMSGDRDEYSSTEAVLAAAKATKGAQLSIIPGCGHVVFFCNFAAVWEAIRPFIGSKS